MCAAGLVFGRFPNKGRCFWQFSSAQPGILREIKKGADYKAFYPPLFTLPELLHLKASVAEFAGLSDDQVRDAYAIMGGIARPVLFLQSRGEKSVADMHNDVKAKIAKMGDTGWKVRRGVLLALLGLGMLWLLASVKVHMHGMIKLPAHLPAGQRRP